MTCWQGSSQQRPLLQSLPPEQGRCAPHSASQRALKAGETVHRGLSRGQAPGARQGLSLQVPRLQSCGWDGGAVRRPHEAAVVGERSSMRAAAGLCGSCCRAPWGCRGRCSCCGAPHLLAGAGLVRAALGLCFRLLGLLLSR